MKDVVRNGKVIGQDFDGSEDDEDMLQALADCRESITYKSYTAAKAAVAIECKHGEKSERVWELARKMGYAKATLDQYSVVARRLTWDDIDGSIPFTLYRNAVNGITSDILLKKVIHRTIARADIDGVDSDKFKEKVAKVENAWKSGAPIETIDLIIEDKIEREIADEFLESDEFTIRYNFTENEVDILAGEIAAQIIKKMMKIRKEKKVDLIVGRAAVKVDYKNRKVQQ